jgi:small subunit ribosomal protein S17
MQKTEELRHKKEQQGVVSKTAMDKTVVVKVTRQVAHPVFRKIVRKSKSFLVHDEKNECKVGDVVKIVETRPLSKNKRWRLSSVISSDATLSSDS